MPDAWSQVFRLTSSAYWGIISTGSIFFHSLSLLLSRAYTEVSSFLLPSPHTVLMRGYIEIHSVKWDKVSIQSRRDYEKDFVRVCTCAYFMLWYLETMSCSAQWVCNMTKQKNNIGKKRSEGGKKIVPQAFRARRLHLFFIHWEYVSVFHRDCPATIKSPAWLIPRVLHTVHCTHRHTHTTTGGMILLNLYCDVRIRKGYGNTFLSAQSFKYFPPFIFSSAIRHAPSIHREILTNASWAGDES